MTEQTGSTSSLKGNNNLKTLTQALPQLEDKSGFTSFNSTIIFFYQCNNIIIIISRNDREMTLVGSGLDSFGFLLCFKV